MLNKSRHILFLNGEIPNHLPDINRYETIYCTDGAYHYLKKKNIQPHYICGDFDSFPLTQVPDTIQTILLEDQNETDFEKTLQFIINQDIKTLDIYGATNGTLDHYLGNLHTAKRFNTKISLTFYDDKQYYFLIHKSCFLNLPIGKIVSLIPFPKAKEIELSGFEYPLIKEDLTLGKRIGIRNKTIHPKQTIELKSGFLWIIIPI